MSHHIATYYEFIQRTHTHRYVCDSSSYDTFVFNASCEHTPDSFSSQCEKMCDHVVRNMQSSTRTGSVQKSCALSNLPGFSLSCIFTLVKKNSNTRACVSSYSYTFQNVAKVDAFYRHGAYRMTARARYVHSHPRIRIFLFV